MTDDPDDYRFVEEALRDRGQAPKRTFRLKRRDGGVA